MAENGVLQTSTNRGLQKAERYTPWEKGCGHRQELSSRLSCPARRGKSAAHGLTAGRLASNVSTCASSSPHSLASRNRSSLQTERGGRHHNAGPAGKQRMQGRCVGSKLSPQEQVHGVAPLQSRAVGWRSAPAAGAACRRRARASSDPRRGLSATSRCRRLCSWARTRTAAGHRRQL